MKRHLNALITGNNSFAGGIAALGIIALIALGCTCNRSIDLANLGSGSANASSDNTTGSDAKDSDDRDSKYSDVPSKGVTESLVKDTLDKFTSAVDSNDFSELYDSASPDFQSTYTKDEMTRFFKSYTDKRRVVVPILEKTQAMDVAFSRDPSIRSEKGLKILMAAGEFKTKPYKVRFDFEYVMRGGEWKLLKMVINVP